MIRSVIILTGFVCLKTCHAQEMQVYHHLSFREVDAIAGDPVSAPNGVIDPGEAAVISLSFSFSPGVGALVPQLPHLQIHAFARTSLDIDNRFRTPGIWSHLQKSSGWDYEVLHAGYPTSFGGVQWIQPSQAFPGANQSNPVLDVWQGRWTPTFYELHEAAFMTFPRGATGFQNSSMLWVVDSANPQMHARVTAWSNIDEITIPIVPSPAAGSVLIAACLFGRRRRGEVVGREVKHPPRSVGPPSALIHEFTCASRTSCSLAPCR